MKQLGLLIFLIVFTLHPLHAQFNTRAIFQVGIPDKSSNTFFVQNPNVYQVSIRYEDKNAEYVGVEKNGKTEKIESYTLSFEGDLYLLKKKYPQLVLFEAADLRMYEVSGIRMADSNTNYFLTKRIRRDSTFYEFSYYTIIGKVYPYPKNKRKVQFAGNIAKFREKFTKSYKAWKPTISDSVLFINGTVENNGMLIDLKLKNGEPSQFSQKVLEFIQQEATFSTPPRSWRPKLYYNITLFIRINKDESITFSAL